jgi:hypothetical protein
MTNGLIEPIPRRPSMGYSRDTPGKSFAEFIQWQFRRIQAGTKRIHWAKEKQQFEGIDFN